MESVANRRSTLTLFTSADCSRSHCVRLVLAEKGVEYDLCETDPADPPEDLLYLNPYQSIPTLVDRDLVLFDVRVIMEYLDERFPHPPLMPIDPVNRARVRLSLCRIEKDWYSLADIVETKTGKTRDKARASLAESIAGSAALFKSQPFFLSDEITLADCSAAVLLSRLPSYDIELPKHAKPVQDYIAKMSGRSAFAESLTSPDSV